MEDAGFDVGFQVGQTDTMYTLWKLYDRGQIIDRLHVVCPGHGFKKTSLKIQMLVSWVQSEDIGVNPDITGRIQSYSGARLDTAPIEFRNDHNSRLVFLSTLPIFIYGEYHSKTVVEMELLCYREHRSGLKVPTGAGYKPNRGDRLIGFSYEQMMQMYFAGSRAGFHSGQIDKMRVLWKLYDREHVVDRLDIVCPGHGYTKDSLKIPMLVLWIQNEDINQNQEILQKIQSYSDLRLYKMPTEKEE